MVSTATGFLLALFVTSVIGGSYLVTSPKSIILSTPFEVTVDILNTSQPVSVSAQIQNQYYNDTTRKWEVDILKEVSDTFVKGQTGRLTLPIEDTFDCSGCRFHVIGRGGLLFERDVQISLYKKLVSVLIQTDKAIYKPGQIVRYRALAVYPNLELYQGTFNIRIKDPNNNKIKIEKGLSSTSGVVEGSLELSDQPPFGDWSIEVSLDEAKDSASQTFTVEDYVLPRFEIKVDLPPYILLNATRLSGKVHAKYTFGQPVKGRVELRIGPNQGLDSCGKLPPAVETTFEIDGKAEFSVPKSDIQRVTNVYDRSKIRVTAFVKEAATGVRLNGSSTITFYAHEYNVKFLENTPSVFKPGLPYSAFVQVHTPDNMPPPVDESDSVSVYAYATYKVGHPEIGLYGVGQFTGTYPLPGYNTSLPASGVLPIELEIPDNATSINLLVHYKGRSAAKTVSKPHSKSNNYIQLILDDKNLKAGDTASLRIQATEPLNDVTYVVLSRGRILSTQSLMGSGSNTLNFEVPIIAEMAPTAHLLAYYNKDADEIIADSIAFNVDGIFSNEVSVEFSTEKAAPGEEIDVIVTADPDSQVNLLAVDQSVLLLKSGNDITAKKVEDAISEYDRGQKPSDSDFALSYSSMDMATLFRQTGLNVITDVRMSQPRRPVYTRTGYDVANFAGSDELGLHEKVDSDFIQLVPDTTAFKDVGTIRKVFPEAWLWQKSRVSDDGQAVISTKVPDTITSWIASAFATNLNSGLGVSATTAKMTVFKPFFVSLTYPSTIKINEIAIIQATVFNYLPQELEVEVTLVGTPYFGKAVKVTDGLTIEEPGEHDAQRVRVPSDEQVTVYFPITGRESGVADLEVTARSRSASDGVSRQIAIEPEGAPVTFNYPMLAQLDGRSEFKKSFVFPLPEDAVKDSQTARAKISGDLIGPSLDNIENLLSLPTGCGEQSMVKFAPNLYIAQYLKTTDQMTEFLEKKIMRLLSSGYQRQLTYQRYDGAFSAFGNLDESGSTWLTAFVLSTMREAMDFIYVDPGMMLRAADWLLGRQGLDGSFHELGRVLDPNTQSKGSSPALTAYVLLSFLKNKDIGPIMDCEKMMKNCHKAWRFGNSTQNAIAYLEMSFESITCPYTLSLISYALGEAGSEAADEVFDKLLGMAENDGSLQYWNAEANVNKDDPAAEGRGRSKFIWRPPRVQGRPIDILITSYALLSYASRDRIEDGLNALQWLTSQRNSRGGFASTQDTVVALQALATFASKSTGPDSKVKIVITGDKKRYRFRVNPKNSLMLQVQEFKRVPRKIDVKMIGKGLVLAEIDYSFNIKKELSTPSFDVSPVLLDDDIDSFNLMICTKWRWDRKTGMVVQEIGIPSGFSPDLTTLGTVVGMKRSERRGNIVAIYFDEIGKTSTCYSLLMTRVSKVARSQASYIKTYDYYEPGDQATVFYHPRKLKESTISDVCPKC